MRPYGSMKALESLREEIRQRYAAERDSGGGPSAVRPGERREPPMSPNPSLRRHDI